jgi:hypothetical protein
VIASTPRQPASGLLVLHGDEFDSVVKCSRWLAVLGSHAYDFSIEMNRHFNRIRRFFGYEYWSLANYLKHKVKNAVNYISSFEQAVAHEVRRRGVDGVVCGHIHRAEISRIDGVLYCNDGDWVESCTALVEDRNGRLAIWNWTSGDTGAVRLVEDPDAGRYAAAAGGSGGSLTAASAGVVALALGLVFAGDAQVAGGASDGLRFVFDAWRCGSSVHSAWRQGDGTMVAAEELASRGRAMGPLPAPPSQFAQDVVAVRSGRIVNLTIRQGETRAA